MRCSHFFVLAFIGFVSARTIYDVHAFERLNTTELLALQRSRGMTNAKILAEGVKRLQPPKPLASKIVEGKKRRANPVDTAWKAKRSAPVVSSCGMIWAEDTNLQTRGYLNYGLSFFYRCTLSTSISRPDTSSITIISPLCLRGGDRRCWQRS
ncbi:hypothetical protein SISSUDRAFT_132847 [Sistotremastrum suecicum HHB10207 ss-3]|uniref:Secreted RxLR effector peptide protein n=1 Tax=Sistotremastrum suecicum HHB10207 ss-3 TaxID=1314776 RepID=A0A166AVZ5_9AGAM|nr:hypothetical protein SISSUDRAFT_132847 [Sistotremastrum suecicum HHB10207 ss-3]